MAFRWQQGYGAFTVAKDDLPVVQRYVLDQPRHHHAGRLLLELEPREEDADTPPAS